MGLTQASIVGLSLFIAGLIYHAGQMSQRLSTVERDQNRMYEELRKIVDALNRLIGSRVPPEGE